MYVQYLVLCTKLTDRVDSEFSGHMRDGLSYLVKAYENDGQGVARDVEYLEAAMAGMGTKDERLYVPLL
jgi:annexin A7/11